MTLNEVIRVNYQYLLSEFPKRCTNCGRTFATLHQWVLETRRIGEAMSYDAELGDWQAPDPLGTLALANCPCGNTIALTTAGIPLEKIHVMLQWLRGETERRGVTASQVLDEIRDGVRALALADPGR
jgi:hypothetical protein